MASGMGLQSTKTTGKSHEEEAESKKNAKGAPDQVEGGIERHAQT